MKFGVFAVDPWFMFVIKVDICCKIRMVNVNFRLAGVYTHCSFLFPVVFEPMHMLLEVLFSQRYMQKPSETD